jgi:L-2,4-diaminobutyrate decarboxylase
MMDEDFLCDSEGLKRAVALLDDYGTSERFDTLPLDLPEAGIGSRAALERLAPTLLGGAARLGSDLAFAHMDPPTPWITWATSLWNASLNQNLLHPATAPVARDVEEAVIRWLSPSFGMNGGHMTPGSTLANLTALWAARECADVQKVFASESSHLSIAKAARLLGLSFRQFPVDRTGALESDALPKKLTKAALVLTAGTTSTGVIDDLNLAGRAAWTHIDAAWAGPLRLTKYADRLAGIDRADSVSVSAHKWLFQPKESALVLFRDTRSAHAAITFGGSYLATPNVGILGSHGATAVPLLATLLAWGREGVARRIEHCMSVASEIAACIATDSRLELLSAPETGIVVWRPKGEGALDPVLDRLPKGLASTTTVGSRRWIRMVAANPNADAGKILEVIRAATASD